MPTIDDVKREFVSNNARRLPFYRSIGYVLPEELMPMLATLPLIRRPKELLALKAARAADGFDTVIPVE